MRDLAGSLIRPLDFGRTAPFWSWLAPVVALGALAVTGLHIEDGAVALALAALIVPAVMAAVHHAEVIAVKVGEPLGTLVLALAVTVIECALIITLMLSKPEESASLVRDTVYSAVMIILGGVVGLCLLVGAARHHVLRFGLDGVSAATVTLVAMSGLVLILPDYTMATEGPYFSTSQLLLVGAACLVLWGMFVFVQTVRHRDYFLPEDGGQDAHHGSGSCTTRQAWLAGGLLLLCLVAVVLLAKSLSDPLAAIIVASGAPLSAVGVLIAGVVLLPESVAAVRAAAANRLQTSLNLALGSSLATIGLTVPVIAVLSVIFGWRLELGLEPLGITLLALMLFVASLSLATGRTTVQQGAVHLVIFAVFLFTSFNP